MSLSLRAGTGRWAAAVETQAVFQVIKEPWAQSRHGLNPGLGGDLAMIPSNQDPLQQPAKIVSAKHGASRNTCGTGTPGQALLHSFCERAISVAVY